MEVLPTSTYVLVAYSSTNLIAEMNYDIASTDSGMAGPRTINIGMSLDT